MNMRFLFTRSQAPAWESTCLQSSASTFAELRGQTCRSVKLSLIPIGLLTSLSLLINCKAADPLATGRATGGSLTPVLPRTNEDPARGIVLYAGWDKRATLPNRKENHDMADLRAILKNYGEPRDDVDLHPEAEVFPGIRYLTPLKQALAALSKQFGASGIGLEVPIATEGFPLGLFFKKFDKNGDSKADFKHPYTLSDKQGQVIGVAFAGVHQPFVKAGTPPFTFIPGRRFRQNLIDGKAPGDRRVFVSDNRRSGNFVIVHSMPPFFPEPDPTVPIPPENLRDGTGTSYTWYVPQPLVNLILYCSQLN